MFRTCSFCTAMFLNIRAHKVRHILDCTIFYSSKLYAKKKNIVSLSIKNVAKPKKNLLFSHEKHEIFFYPNIVNKIGNQCTI